MSTPTHLRRSRSAGLAALAAAAALTLAGCATTPERQRSSLDASVACAAGERLACRSGRVDVYGRYDPWGAYYGRDPWYRHRYYRDPWLRGRHGYRDPWGHGGYVDPFWGGHRWGAPGYYWHDPRLGGGRYRRDPGRQVPPAPGTPAPPVQSPAPAPEHRPPPPEPSVGPWQGSMRANPLRTEEP